MRTIEVYCDGSGTTADTPAGYGWVLVLDGVPVREDSGHIPAGTNNDAELAAAIKGLMACKEYASERSERFRVLLRSDSQLVLGWASGRFEISREDRKPAVKVLRQLFNELDAVTSWVRGHAGHEHNERADALAHFGRTGEWKRKRDAKCRALQGKPRYDEMDLKRFYLPGVTMPTTCDACKHPFTLDMSQHYPCSIEATGVCKLYFTCPECDHEHARPMLLQVILSEKLR
jgi:ribonuclease HI